MGIRSEPSSTSLSNEGATRAICQDGKWYKPVTVEYAFSVRMDVPEFRRAPWPWGVGHFLLPVAIEIDSPKPEYEPCDDSSSPP